MYLSLGVRCPATLKRDLGEVTHYPLDIVNFIANYHNNIYRTKYSFDFERNDVIFGEYRISYKNVAKF